MNSYLEFFFAKQSFAPRWVPKFNLGTRIRYALWGGVSLKAGTEARPTRSLAPPPATLFQKVITMPDWGEIFAAPEMQSLQPNPEFLGILPGVKAAGCRRVLDAGCGAGRHILPLLREGFQVWGVDREAGVLEMLQGKLRASEIRAHLALADLERLPFAAASFHLGVSINVINHGDTRTFQAYCRELDRVLKPQGHPLVYLSPREAGDLVSLTQDAGMG